MSNILSHFNQHMIARRVEVELIPFTQCNVDCLFCEYRDKRVHLQSSDIFDHAFDTLSEHYVDQYDVVVMLWGGELFADNVDRSVFDLYEQFIQRLYDKYKQKLTVSFKTNLIHHNVDVILKLCHKFPFLTIGASFDLEGRFVKQSQIDTFLANLFILQNHNINLDITVVAHKQNIEALLSKTGKHYDVFQTLYQIQNWDIDFEYYYDVGNLPQYAVSDEQLEQFVKYLILNYPRVSEVRKLTQRALYNAVDDTAYIHDGLAETYITISPFQTTIEKGKDHLNYMFKTKHCMSCKWFANCSPRYPTETSDSSFCINRNLFQYIIDNEHIVRQLDH